MNERKAFPSQIIPIMIVFWFGTGIVYGHFYESLLAGVITGLLAFVAHAAIMTLFWLAWNWGAIIRGEQG